MSIKKRTTVLYKVLSFVFANSFYVYVLIYFTLNFQGLVWRLLPILCLVVYNVSVFKKLPGWNFLIRFGDKRKVEFKNGADVFSVGCILFSVSAINEKAEKKWQEDPCFRAPKDFSELKKKVREASYVFVAYHRAIATKGEVVVIKTQEIRECGDDIGSWKIEVYPAESSVGNE